MVKPLVKYFRYLLCCYMGGNAVKYLSLDCILKKGNTTVTRMLLGSVSPDWAESQVSLPGKKPQLVKHLYRNPFGKAYTSMGIADRENYRSLDEATMKSGMACHSKISQYSL